MTIPEFMTLQLDVLVFDFHPYQVLLSRLASKGITFVTLADEQEQEPDWLARFCSMDNAVRSHDPRVPRTLE